MASEIHKKRTGKGFKISEEIVMKEEMYEEDDDDLPHRLRNLGRHLTTGSAVMNHRVNAYLSNKVAMSQSVQHMEDVNRQFAEQFPAAAQQLAQLQRLQMQSMYNPPVPLHWQANPPPSSYPHSPYTTYTAPHPAHTPVLHSTQGPVSHPTQSPLHHPGHSRRTQSMGQIEPTVLAASPHDTSSMASSGVPPTRHASFDDHITPALTPGSTRTDTPFSNTTPPEYQAGLAFCRLPDEPSALPVDPSLVMPSSLTHPYSPFTSELPANAKGLVAGFDDTFLNGFYDDGGELTSPPSFYHPGFETFHFGQADHEVVQKRDIPIPSSEAHISTEAPSASKLDTYDFLGADSHIIEPTVLHGSRIGTPDGGAGGDSWEQWIHHDQPNDCLDCDGAYALE
jgi:hypothetical protein